MHICTVATLCFPEKTFPRNYYYCVQDENSLCLCFKNMYRTLFVAIFTSTFIFSMYDHILVCLDAFSHTYRNINISNLRVLRTLTSSELTAIYMIIFKNNSLGPRRLFKIMSKVVLHNALCSFGRLKRLYGAVLSHNWWTSSLSFPCNDKFVKKKRLMKL